MVFDRFGSVAVSAPDGTRQRWWDVESFVSEVEQENVCMARSK
jgi:hypothetical protein